MKGRRKRKGRRRWAAANELAARGTSEAEGWRACPPLPSGCSYYLLAGALKSGAGMATNRRHVDEGGRPILYVERRLGLNSGRRSANDGRPLAGLPYTATLVLRTCANISRFLCCCLPIWRRRAACSAHGGSWRVTARCRWPPVSQTL